jgi:hypothetical protein
MSSFNIKEGGTGFKQYHWEVKDGWVLRDGEKVFIKGVHYPAIYDDATRLARFSAVDRIKNVGFNVIQAPLKITNFDDALESHDDKFISQCHYRGINVIVANNDPGGYLACFDYYGEHPGCMGFYSYDDVQNQSFVAVNNRYKELKRRYPNRLVYASGGTSNMEAKTGDWDIVAYQRYPMVYSAADSARTATVNGNQTGVTNITVNSGYTVQLGEKVSIQTTSVVVERNITALPDATHVTISGAAIDVNNAVVMTVVGETYSSLASTTTEMVKVQKPNMVGNSATLINNQMFKWYNCEEWVASGVTKRIGNYTTYCNSAGANYHPIPSALTETHYRNILYQGLLSGKASGFMAYAWADWVYREAGLSEENNLTTNSTLQLAVRRCNAEIDYMVNYFKYGEFTPLIMPSESYAGTWAYKGKLLIIGINGKALPGTISSANEIVYNMRGKVRNPFPYLTSTSLTNDRKTLTWTALPWNATEIYEVAISD